MIRVLNNNIQRFDLNLLLYFAQQNTSRPLLRFFYGLSRFGDGHLYVLWGISNILFNREAGLKYFCAGVVAFAIELPVYFLIKKNIKRARPGDLIKGITNLIVPPDKYSFPSGHTSAAFLMAALVAIQFPMINGFLFAVAGLIGFSRVYLRVHFPTDVLAGAIIGILSAHAGIWIVF